MTAKRLHLPQTRIDVIVCAIFWGGGLFTLAYELFVVYQSYHEDPWNTSVLKYHMLVGLSLAVIIYSYMGLIISTDVSVKALGTEYTALTSVDPPPGWTYCDKCQLNSPPRSHHCKLCDICILKRDHHCYFSGYCIGFQNQRYYISMIFYCCIATTYCNIYNWDFVMAAKGGFTWTTIPSFIAPHVGLCHGYYTLYEAVITFLTSIGLFLMIMMYTLLFMQIKQFLRGQVKHEVKKNIVDYSLGWQTTKDEIFGSMGFLVFLFPSGFISTTYPSDGTWFPRNEKKME